MSTTGEEEGVMGIEVSSEGGPSDLAKEPLKHRGFTEILMSRAYILWGITCTNLSFNS